MPFGRARDDDRAGRVFDQRAIRPGRRLLHGFELDLAALAVQPVKRRCDVAGFQNIVRGEQARAEPRVADAARPR